MPPGCGGRSSGYDGGVEKLPGDLMRAVRVSASLRGEKIQDLMVSIPAPRVAELETEAFQHRLEGRSQPRRRGRERQVAGKKGGA